jgi:nucleotide-binding universal stress UspA family protein
MDDAPVLICYDGSAAADRAIEVAAQLLGTERRAVVLNIGAEITPSESLATLSPLVSAQSFESVNTDDARRRAQAGTERALTAGFVATPRAKVAAPTWQAIVDVADELDAAVIVIGSRGLHGAREALDGSVSHEVATHAGRPVLIVPPLR